MSIAEQQSLSGIAVDVDHNPYLAEGAGTVDAIISVAVGNEMVADKPPERVEAIIIDCSTSMLSPRDKFEEAKRATKAAVNEMVDGTFFTIVAGTEKAAAVYPEDGKPVRVSEASRTAAAHAVDSLRANWHRAAEWLPRMEPAVRQKGYRKWRKAVERTMDWVDEDDDDDGF